MRKKSKRILAAALSAILIWNTCGWQPQALAADSLQRIGAETEADDTAETAEKEAALKKSALKASPSNAEAKDNRGESGTNKAEAESGADAGKAEAGADADTGKAEAGADAGADKAEAGANEAIVGTDETPNGTATGAEIKAFLELDEAIAVQKLSLGAKESDIILPDTLEVEVEGADEMLAEDSQNVHLVEAANKGTEKDTEAETATWQISGITWKLNEEQSDLPEFHGGISEKDYFEEFDENGEPVETSTKTWGGLC